MCSSLDLETLHHTTRLLQESFKYISSLINQYKCQGRKYLLRPYCSLYQKLDCYISLKTSMIYFHTEDFPITI